MEAGKGRLRLALYSVMSCPTNANLDRHLQRLVGNPNARIGYVACEPETNREDFYEAQKYYLDLGLRLDVYLDSESVPFERSCSRLLECDAIHLGGGNTFYFLDWVRRTGLDKLLRRHAHNGKVLVGMSAGAILMTPSIHSAELCGDPRPMDGRDDAALDLVPFLFWPHYQDGQEHWPDATWVFDSAIPIFGCPDGGGIIVDGNEWVFFGGLRRFGGGTLDASPRPPSPGADKSARP